MEPRTEIDIASLERKIRRSGVAAIVFAYLLALFSSIDSSFFWIFLGAATYSVFLWAYYRAQKNPAPERPANPWFASGPQTSSNKSRLRVLLPIVVGISMFIVIIRLIISAAGSNGESVNNPDQSSEETTTDGDQDLNALTEKGNQWYNQGKYDSALVYYNRVLATDPENKFALYNTALVQYAKKDFRRAVPILMNCTDNNPEYGEAWWLLGDVYLGLNNQDSTKICLDMAYDNGLRNGTFLQQLAGLYEQTDKVKAFKLYLESISADSTLTDSYTKLSALDPEHADQYQRLIKKWKK